MTQEQENWEWMDARVKKLEEHCFPAEKLTDEEVEQIIKQWFNLPPFAKLDEPVRVPLYSVFSLCKGILKKGTK